MAPRIFAPFTRSKALTASVSVMTVDQRKKLQSKPSTKWQEAAWNYFHILPEVQYAAKFYGNCLGRCRFFVGKRDSPNEPLNPIPDDDPLQKAMEETLSRVRGRDGTFASLARAYGMQQFVAGESYLVGDDGTEGEKWEMLSGKELRKIDGVNRRFDPAGGSEIVPSTAVVMRMWQRDPEFSMHAHSQMRGVLDICEAMVVSQAMLTSGDRNRLASNGLLPIPSEAGLPHVGEGPARHLKLLDDLIDQAVTTMDDPGSPAAHFPVLLEMKSEFIEPLRAGVIRFDREVDKTLVERIDYLVRRYAQGIDLPPEIVTGKADSNHWTAWAIAQDVISSHVGPMAATLCEDLTSGLIWSTLESMGIGPADRVQYGVWFDPTDLAVNPDRVADYTLAFDRMAVSWEAYRAVVGAGEDEKPDAAEIELRASLGHRLPSAAGDARLPVTGDPQEGPPPQGAIDGEQGAAPAKGAGTAGTGGTGGTTGGTGGGGTGK